MPVFANKKDTIKDYVQQYVSKEENSSIWCDTYHFTYWAYAESNFPDIYFKDSYGHYEVLMNKLQKKFPDTDDHELILYIASAIATLEDDYIRQWKEASNKKEASYKNDDLLTQLGMC